MKTVDVGGGGLAGSEAAYQVSKRGVAVRLYEMRPGQSSPAHHTDHLAELVCSNSLKSNQLDNASGLLKEEMRQLDSLIMQVADSVRVPAGHALAVDREAFSNKVTERIQNMPNIQIIREEVKQLPSDDQDIWIIASGPLTSPSLLSSIQIEMGEPSLHFFDAAAPLISVDSIDFDKVYRASRYDKGEADYLNCPFRKEEYITFWHALVEAEQVELHDFEIGHFFEGCIPVEELARRGQETLAYGPLKPMGLKDPKTGITPYAVAQLRQDNVAGNLYGLVGFQTNLKFKEQERVFQKIPGLVKAEFVRYGVMHRNAYIRSPKWLSSSMQLKHRQNIFFAGQISGVEGYMESTASGLLCGVNAALLACDKEPLVMPRETMMGALLHYVSHCDDTMFQPMNAVFGIIPPLNQPIRNKKLRYQQYSDRALFALQNWKACNHI